MDIIFKMKITKASCTLPSIIDFFLKYMLTLSMHEFVFWKLIKLISMKLGQEIKSRQEIKSGTRT